MTDVIDGPHGTGQPARDELPAAQLPAPTQPDDSRPADPARSASDSFGTRPLVMESATIPLRQRLAGRARPARQQTVALTPAALPSEAPAPEAPASDTMASAVQAPGGLASAALRGETPSDVARVLRNRSRQRSRPGHHHGPPAPEHTGGKS